VDATTPLYRASFNNVSKNISSIFFHKLQPNLNQTKNFLYKRWEPNV
jgi:hypothetical protein